jgi:hypothetical protein
VSGFEKLLIKFGGVSEDPTELPQPSPKGASLEQFIQDFGGVTESYWFYDKAIELRFSTEDHIYYRVGELGNLLPVNGVTQTCGIIDKSFALVPWAAKMVVEKLLRIIPTETVGDVISLRPLTLEEFTRFALDAKGAHKEKLETAGDIGRAAHLCLEDSIKHAIAETDNVVTTLVNTPFDAQAEHCARVALAWMQTHKVRWTDTERKIYSRTHNYAGTLDAIAYVSSCDDRACCPEAFEDRLCLIDFKTSNALRTDYCLQVAAYQKAIAEELGIEIKSRIILRLGKEDGAFQPWFLPEETFSEDFSAFLTCLQLTRIMESIEERMKGQRNSIKSIKKEQKEMAKAAEKVNKALAKVEAKRLKEIDKAEIKTQAKATREAAKLAYEETTVTPVFDIPKENS